tara:strand:- start:349 stop:543 length:195 start_codon:yes stop_codon:yes gene_type:complete
VAVVELVVVERYLVEVDMVLVVEVQEDTENLEGQPLDVIPYLLQVHLQVRLQLYLLQFKVIQLQ